MPAEMAHFAMARGVTEVQVHAIGPIALTYIHPRRRGNLPPGHRLRVVEVSSSNFPRFDRNLNTGGKNYDETTWKVAKNSVWHTPGHVSRLVLAVVSR